MMNDDLTRAADDYTTAVLSLLMHLSEREDVEALALVRDIADSATRMLVAIKDGVTAARIKQDGWTREQRDAARDTLGITHGRCIP